MTTGGGNGSGERPRLCMFVYNTFTNDSRVLNTSRTLAAGGHAVTLIARAGPDLPADERRGPLRIVRVDNTALPVRLARRLATRLARRGSGRDESDGTAAEPPEVSTRGPAAWARNALRSTLVRISLPIGQLQYWRRAVSAAARDEADVYYANDLDTLPAAWLARRRRGGDARLVYDAHELFTARDVWPERTRLSLWFWTAVERRLAKRADSALTSSGGMADELVDWYGIERPAIVRNVPLAATPGDDAPDLRAELGLRRELPIILYLGGYQPGRGLEELVDVAAIVPEIAVVAFGMGESGYIAALEARIREARVSDRVKLAGPVAPAAIVRQASGADIGACLIQNTCLTHYHSLPNKLFQYLAAGLPVVASDFPEMGAVVREHDAGVICSPSDPEAIADAVRGMVADSARLADYSANARAAAGELNWETEQPRLVAAVDAGLGHDGGSPSGS